MFDTQVYEFMEKVAAGEAELSEEILNEFAERCKETLRLRVAEVQQREFKLRMSNIGKPLRNLMLEQKYGCGKPDPKFVLKMLYGSLYEALTLALLKASGVDVQEHDTQVSLTLSNTVVDGTLDVILNGKVYDVKTASPYSYEKKFTSWETLAYDDGFGYLGQLFGYAKAKGVMAGGWLVINKVTGEFKVVPIPEDIHDGLMTKYMSELTYKVKHIEDNQPMPPCPGPEEETYFKKPSGNIILGAKCRFCDYKKKCHPTLQYLPSKVSKSADTKYVHYIKVKEDEDEV